MLAKAEAFAELLPASAERDQVLVTSLENCGQADRAADLAWKAALAREGSRPAAADAPCCTSMRRWPRVRKATIVAKLQSMKAPAVIYTAAADALAKAGKTQAAPGDDRGGADRGGGRGRQGGRPTWPR